MANPSKVMNDLGLILPAGPPGGHGSFDFRTRDRRGPKRSEEEDSSSQGSRDKNGGGGGGGDPASGEPSPITKVDRSNSAPNVSHTIMNSAAVEAAASSHLLKSKSKDMRTQGMVQLDELFGGVPTSTTTATAAASAAPPPLSSSSTASSPNKSSSRSVSSSPTSTLKQPRARASSADDSATKKIKAAAAAKEQKDVIEDWEIPAQDILLYKKNIGQGSFGTVYRGYWHGPVAVKTLNVKNPSMEQIQAFRNEVALLRKTRCDRIGFCYCMYSMCNFRFFSSSGTSTFSCLWAASRRRRSWLSSRSGARAPLSTDTFT